MPSSNSCVDARTARSTCRTFAHDATKTLTHVVWDHAMRHAAVIDAVLDYSVGNDAAKTTSADAVLAYLAQHALRLQWILETHVHADHVSAADYLRARAGGRVATGVHVRTVEAAVCARYDLEPEPVAGAAFDHLFEDDESFAIGALAATAWHVPGHTPADLAYRIDGAVFVGDALFMPDVGTGRTDFPGGDARRAFRSIRRLLSLPAETAIYVGHDYPPAHRGIAWRTTVAEQRATNIHARDDVSEEAFVAMRTARDTTLAAPALLVPSLRANVRAGRIASLPDGSRAATGTPGRW